MPCGTNQKKKKRKKKWTPWGRQEKVEKLALKAVWGKQDFWMQSLRPHDWPLPPEWWDINIGRGCDPGVRGGQKRAVAELTTWSLVGWIKHFQAFPSSTWSSLYPIIFSKAYWGQNIYCLYLTISSHLPPIVLFARASPQIDYSLFRGEDQSL